MRIINRTLKPARAVLLVAVLGLMAAACSDKGSNPVSSADATPPPPPTQTALSFKNDIKPIFDKFGCAGCHGGTNNLFVTSVAQLKTGGLHGPAVTPGDGANSILVKKISPTPPFGARMPQGGPYLPDSLQAKIKTWVDQGALDN